MVLNDDSDSVKIVLKSDRRNRLKRASTLLAHKMDDHWSLTRSQQKTILGSDNKAYFNVFRLFVQSEILTDSYSILLFD